MAESLTSTAPDEFCLRLRQAADALKATVSSFVSAVEVERLMVSQEQEREGVYEVAVTTTFRARDQFEMACSTLFNIFEER